MKFCAFVVVFLASIASVIAADSTERSTGLHDAYPACMERDGPDCIIRGQGNQTFSPDTQNRVLVLPSPPTGVGAPPASDMLPRNPPLPGTPLPVTTPQSNPSR
jgi:hypothetical protein